MHTDPTFALVVDRVITLYPVTYDIINARDTPSEEYYPCYYNDMPIIENPIIDYIIHSPKLVGTNVFVNCTLKRKTIEELFVDIGLGPTSILTIADIPANHLEAVVILTKERVQLSLDEFAHSRGYDDIKSTCTYINSQIPTYLAEAQRAIYLRDLTWATLYGFLTNVMSGVHPLPVDWTDISEHLPTLTWE